MSVENRSSNGQDGSLSASPAIKRAAMQRIKTIIGHAQGIERMIEDERYCIDVLKQISAVQAQLRLLGQLLTKSHMENCLADAIEEGRGEEAIEELAEVLKYLDS